MLSLESETEKIQSQNLVGMKIRQKSVKCLKQEINKLMIGYPEISTFGI